jgi:YD repeat-containing protein
VEIAEDVKRSPVLPDDAAITVPGRPDGVVFSAQATDADGHALTYTLSGADAGLFTIDPETGAVRLAATTPDPVPASADGDAVYDLVITASDGVESDSQALTVTLEANTPPATTDPGPLLGFEDVAVDVSLPEGTIVDADGDALIVEMRSPGGAPLPDWLSFEPATRSLTGTPPQDFNGDIPLELFVSDSREDVLQPLTLRITAVNDAPVLVTPQDDLSGTEDTAFALPLDTVAFADVDGDVLSYALTLEDGGALPGWLGFDAQALTLSGTPPLDFNGTLDLRLSASDGQAAADTVFALDIAAVNDAPVITSNGGGATAAVSLAEGLTSVSTLTATDVEGDALTLSVSGGADAGLFAFDPATGALRFVTAPDFEAPGDADGDNAYEVVLSASDGTVATTQALTVTVTDVDETPDNTGPELPGDAAITVLGRQAGVLFDAEATDTDGDLLTYALGGADAALFAIDATTGEVRFAVTTPAPVPVSADGDLVYDLLVLASDGALEDSQALSVTVTPEDGTGGPPAPVAGDDRVTVLQDRALTFEVRDNDDAGDAGVVLSSPLIAQAPQSGQVTVEPDGRLTYTPGLGFVGYDSFVYEVSTAGGADTAQVDVTVNQVIFWQDGTGAQNLYDWQEQTMIRTPEGLLLSQHVLFDSGSERLVEISYDEAGQRTQIVEDRIDGSTRTRTFDSDGELDSLVLEDSAGARPWAAQTTLYDDEGRVVRRQVDFDDGTQSETQYEYDAAGNRTRIVQTQPDGDIMTTTFGENGSRESRLLEDGSDSHPWASQTTLFNADGLVFRRQVDFDDGTQSEMLFEYDAAGNRTRIVQTQPDGDIVTTTFGEDGIRDSQVFEDGSGARPWDERIDTFDDTGALVDRVFVWDVV